MNLLYSRVNIIEFCLNVFLEKNNSRLQNQENEEVNLGTLLKKWSEKALAISQML